MIKQSLDDYLKRSGDKELPSGNIEENDNGFCIWRLQDYSLVLVAVYGDGNYWNRWATRKAADLKVNKILMATVRNPKGFIKKFGFSVKGYILERKS